MIEHLTVFRAVSSYFARRMIKRLTIIALVIFAVLTAIIWVLAYYFSDWWWLFIIPIALLALVFFIVRALAFFLARRLYTQPLSSEHKTDIGNFIDKIERLLEQRQVTPPLMALVSVKDLVMHRELRTIKGIIDDSRTLKK